MLRPGLTGVLAAALAVAPLPSAAVAAPAPPSSPAPSPAPADAGKQYEQGVAERSAGNFVAAAEHFDAAYRELPVGDREIRAGVLFELVDARRNAFAEGEGAPQICEAERLLIAFLDEVKAEFGAKGDKRPDTRKAKKVLAEVRKQIAALKNEVPDLECAREVIEPPAPPEPEPEPPPAPEQDVPKDSEPDPRPRRLVIAGAATAGLGGLFVAMMVAGLAVGDRAERDGAAATTKALLAGTPLSEDDPELQAIVRRGRVGNGLAIASGILATAALAAGVTMIVLGRRPRPAPRAAFAPGFGPGTAFGSLTLKF